VSFIKRGEFMRLSFIKWNLVTGNDDAIGDVVCVNVNNLAAVEACDSK